MKRMIKWMLVVCLLQSNIGFSQSKDSLMVATIIKEATENSQLENLANELLNGIIAGQHMLNDLLLPRAEAFIAEVPFKQVKGAGVRLGNKGSGSLRRDVFHGDLKLAKLSGLLQHVLARRS